jgi:ribonuclease PH
MNEVLTSDRPKERLQGRGRRSLNLSTKLTTDEARAVKEAASHAGKTPSEWARDMLLRSEADRQNTEMEMHIFTELVGIQMLLMNGLEPILRGERLTQDQIAILFRQVQRDKATRAQELLAKRTQNKEK